MKSMFPWSSSRPLLHESTVWHVGLMYCLMAGKTSLILIALIFRPDKLTIEVSSPKNLTTLQQPRE